VTRAKLFVALGLVLLVLIVVFQNTQQVETRFLFLTLTMPRAALLATTLLVGVAIGMLVAVGLAAKRPDKR
jgi:uncharacterized integral membrane protein